MAILVDDRRIAAILGVSPAASLFGSLRPQRAPALPDAPDAWLRTRRMVAETGQRSDRRGGLFVQYFKDSVISSLDITHLWS